MVSSCMTDVFGREEGHLSCTETTVSRAAITIHGYR
jgi:hypothetical protein